jgi:phosphatidate cytidylyltransferase
MRERNELTLRIVSAAVLAPLAVGLAYLGGWPFFAFWTIAACGILWEWRKIVADRAGMLVGLCLGFGLGECAIVAAGATTMGGNGAGAALLIALGMAVEAGMASNPHFRIWMAAGVLYAGSLLVSCVLLRADAGYGFVAIVFLFAIVWASDVMGYFVGRFIGGPKLWMRVSPKKTWSGAAGGALGAIAAALAVAHYAHLANSLAVAGLALLLSASSQAGDLLESAVKRRFGVKDAGHVIPGHGGIMDRLDGFLTAAAVAAMIGIVRGGLDAPARGLLVW